MPQKKFETWRFWVSAQTGWCEPTNVNKRLRDFQSVCFDVAGNRALFSTHTSRVLLFSLAGKKSHNKKKFTETERGKVWFLWISQWPVLLLNCARWQALRTRSSASDRSRETMSAFSTIPTGRTLSTKPQFRKWSKVHTWILCTRYEDVSSVSKAIYVY